MNSFFVILRTATMNLRHNKRRSLLTMLGLIIGIMSVILVMSLGAGAQSLIINQIKGRGTDLIAVLAGASEDNGPPAQAMGIVVTTLTYDDGLALLNKNNVRHGTTVAGYISGNDTLSWKNTDRNVTYTGTNASYPEIERIKLQEGRFFDVQEENAGDPVMVLGSAIAEEIFGNQNPVGQYVKLRRHQFKIIGVLAPIGSTGFENPDIAVLIPLRFAQEQLLGIQHVSFLRLRVDDEQNIPQTIEEVKHTLTERHGDTDFSVRTIASLLDILTTITNGLKFFLVAIAGISLFVGGVGIMNIMLITVKEKTREIGLRKAVGATNQTILIQFLVETIVLALAAGIIGILLGSSIAFLVAKIVQSLDYAYDFIITPTSILISFLIAALIGLVFGLLPAKKAASLRPIEALRYE